MPYGYLGENKVPEGSIALGLTWQLMLYSENKLATQQNEIAHSFSSSSSSPPSSSLLFGENINAFACDVLTVCPREHRTPHTARTTGMQSKVELDGGCRVHGQPKYSEVTSEASGLGWGGVIN